MPKFRLCLRYHGHDRGLTIGPNWASLRVGPIHALIWR